MSLYNRLLNYRPLQAKGIEVVGATAKEVYHILVREGRTLSFLAIPEGDDKREFKKGPSSHVKEGERPLDALEQPDEEETTATARIADNKLQTPYPSAVLQKRLLNTYYAARTYIEEQGVNILFMALGMLEWYESPSSDVTHRAPLILVPVELQRTSVRARFRITYTEDEISENLSLRAKLNSEFKVELPRLPDVEDIDVLRYCQQVSEATKPLSKWSVDETAVVLGFFSFGKFLMFRDLDADCWPTDMGPALHPILRALLCDGFLDSKLELSEDVRIDEHISPEQIHHVVDADSSQALAISDVGSGHNLIIQGPPGTGKSQTITNIVAEAIALGKKVLFVSEKMAALEVVKRRLDNVGLGDACLELHSQKTKKKVVLDELRRTLELRQPRNETTVDLRALTIARDRLNEYSDAVNTPIASSDVTPHQAFGELLLLEKTLAGVQIPAIDSSETRNWSRSEFEQRIAKVEELRTLVHRIGPPVNHTFWGCKRRLVTPAEKESIQRSCEVGLQSVSSLRRSSSKLAQRLGLAAPAQREDTTALVQYARHLLTAPPLEGIQLTAKEWGMDAPALREALAAGARICALHQQYDTVLREQAWETDVSDVRRCYDELGPRWWKTFDGRYRRAKTQFADLCRDKPPRTWKEQLNVLQAIEEMDTHQRRLARDTPLMKQLFGSRWHGLESDWSILSSIVDWLADLHHKVNSGQLPGQLITFLTSQPNLAPLAPDADLVDSDLKKHVDALQTAIQRIDLDERVRFGEDEPLLARPLVFQVETLAAWQQSVDRIQEIVALNHLGDALMADGLGEAMSVATKWPDAGQHLTHAVRHSWYRGLLEKAIVQKPILAAFHGETHNQVVRHFCELDRLSLVQHRVNLALEHWQSLPRYSAGGKLGLLQREFAKKRRHLPIRQLVGQCGSVIQAIKPVFMMSPLSIAMFLPPGSVEFDLVVFDEASQVKPVDAFGAILRGKQLIVVGDARQLPPTMFFESVLDADEDSSENVTSDLESILGLCNSQGMPSRMLRWHYRSWHESLIAVSNQEFYENKLVVFPSPDAGRRSVGLVYHHLPGAVYGRGQSRTNVQEAQAVADAVMQHARTRPDQTLGVAAFSVSQMEAIQDQLEALRRQDASCEEFFRDHPHEPFFVKNLENVQGDERDVIFISVGYGRTADGSISMNFGPLNQDGGERRLNVLITRARQRCEVFTNLTADDIDLRRSSAPGVAVLKRYLQYAQTGELERTMPGYSQHATPFSEVVAAELLDRGFQVQHQVGTAGFFVDLAIVDPDHPGKYVLGIECDGPTYHHTQSARDRDRLREEMLTKLGWRTYRIWSTDWFQNQRDGISRLVERTEQAQAESRGMSAGQQAALVASPSPTDIPIERMSTPNQPKTPSSPQSYQTANLNIALLSYELYQVPMDRVAGWVRQVVDIESPVHRDEVARRIAECVGVKRIGSRIQGTFDGAIAYAVKKGMVVARGPFLWASGRQGVTLRRRDALPVSARKIEYIAPEELAIAVEEVVATSFGIQRENIPPEVGRLVGFGRVSNSMREYVDAVVDRLVKEGRLVSQGEYLVVTRD